MIYAFDLDNTLCLTYGNQYAFSTPCYDRISIVNNLFSSGNEIIIYTARGSVSGLTKELENLTTKQLEMWNISYTKLVMGKKINFDLLIDDKAHNADNWFESNKIKTIGFVASSFDLLHPGYIKMLKDAKTVCGHLICAIHENPKTERQEKNIPIHSLEERIEILNSIKYVNSIKTYSSEEELYNLLKNINPDVRILGTDYKDKKFTGDDLNIKIHWHERNHNYSTSNLRRKIKIHEQ